MEKTPFAGLTQLAREDPLSTDGASFQSVNPRLTDRLLEIGAVSHRHDAHAALADPVAAPSATVFTAGGSIPADLTLAFGYTLIDFDLGETALSNAVESSTPPSVDPAENAPVAEIDYTGGSLVSDVYYYAVTLDDGEGGETPVGPWAEVEREPGFASGRVQLSGLTADLIANPDAVGWRLYRARGGNEFVLLATGTANTFTDDGSVSPDCDAHPPADTDNTTIGANRFNVVVPSAVASGGAASFRLYASVDGSFTEDCLVGDYPLASAGVAIAVTNLDFDDERPPDVSTSVRGASKIDPDTDLLDWHWKRPVQTIAALGSGARGDVRLVFAEEALYAAFVDTPNSAGWERLTGVGGGGGPGTFTVSDLDEEYGGITALEFLGGAEIADLGGGSASVTVSGGGGGASSLEVRDDDESVSPVSSLKFTGAAELSSQGGGSATVAIAHGSGGRLHAVGDADEIMRPVSSIHFVGAELTDLGGGSAQVAIPEIPERWQRGETTVNIAGLGASAAAASGASGTIQLASGYRLLKLTTNRPAWTKLYATAAHRDADAARRLGDDPVGDHGVVIDFATFEGDLSWALTPIVEGADLKAPPDGAIPVHITNLDDAAGTVSVTLLWVRTE